jgi:hypothetical protein
MFRGTINDDGVSAPGLANEADAVDPFYLCFHGVILYRLTQRAQRRGPRQASFDLDQNGQKRLSSKTLLKTPKTGKTDENLFRQAP